MGKHKWWTEEENDYLRKNYKKIPRKEIIDYLNRTSNSIYNQIRELGLSDSNIKPIRVFPQELRDRMSNSHLGKKLPKKQRKKISNSLKESWKIEEVRIKRLISYEATIEKRVISRKKNLGIYGETEEEKIIRRHKYEKISRKNNYKKTKKRQKIYRQENPEKCEAHRKARKHIKIPKGQLCEICNERKAFYRHHDDYSKPLEVKFLCAYCHNRLHRRLQSQMNTPL